MNKADGVWIEEHVGANDGMGRFIAAHSTDRLVSRCCSRSSLNLSFLKFSYRKR